MKTCFLLLLVVMSMNSASADTLTIVHVNDTHSNLAPGGPRNANLEGKVGGIARAATYIQRVRNNDPEAIVLHAGDASVGDLFYQKYFCVAEMQLMSAIGFNAMTIGNHEFDLGPTVLQASLESAFAEGQAFPLLSANLVLPTNDVQGLARFIQSRTIVSSHGLKVGIFGLTTPETNLLSQPAPAILDTALLVYADANVKALRDSGCTVVILLSHLGKNLDKVVAQNVPGIDLIVGGHDHNSMESGDVSAGVPIVQAGAFYRSIGQVHLIVEDDVVKLLDARVDALDESVEEDPAISAAVATLVAGIEESYGPMYSEAVAQANDDCLEEAVDLFQPGYHDTPLGNLVTDAFREFGKTDVAIQPGGSMAQPLYGGPLVGSDVFRSIGYGFNADNGLGYRMVTCTVSGADIMKGLEYGLSTIDVNDEFLIQCSGMKYTYDARNEPGSRLTSVMIQDHVIEPGRAYSMTANEFVLAFFSILGIDAKDVVIHGDTTEFMVLLDYVARMQSINPKAEGRVLSEQPSSVRVNRDSGRLQLPIGIVGDNDLTLTLPIVPVNGLFFEVYDSSLRRVDTDYSIVHESATLHMDTSTLKSGAYYFQATLDDVPLSGSFLVIR